MTTTAPNQIGTLAIDLIGNTPLVRLAKVTADLPAGVTLCAKAEWLQSRRLRQGPPRALDDPAKGARAALLTPGKIILEATSGNTGIA